jgi:hypothetical protein
VANANAGDRDPASGRTVVDVAGTGVSACTGSVRAADPAIATVTVDLA